MQNADWSDFKLFFHVAAEGGLSGAAERTGLSAPTIGRRMLALERATGRALFVRSQQGYRLAHDGEILLEHVRTMQKTADTIADWHKDAFALPIVSIASDAWISGHVADNARYIRGKADAFRFCCKSLHAGIDITYRETDVAIVAHRPETGNVAARRSVNVAYAVYRSTALSAHEDVPWVSIGTESSRSAADKWVFQHHESGILTWTGGPELLLRLIRAGAGRGLLPCFVGDACRELERDGEIIEELSHPLWIVANDDDRHRPEVRLVIERLAELFKRDEKRLAGTP